MPATLTLIAPVHSARQHPREVIHAATKLTITFAVRLRDQSTIVPITGMAVKFRGRRDLRDTVDLFEITGAVLSGPAGTCTVDLVEASIPSDVRLLWAELVLEEAGAEIYQVAYKLELGSGVGA